MEYIALSNQVSIPVLGIGTFLLSPDEAEASVLHALQHGYRLVDTANAYINERAVGRAIRRSGVPREEIFLETKLWPTLYESDTAIDETLKRLDTNYIDLMLLHQSAGDYISGYLKLEKAYKEGKLRAIGISNFSEEMISEILDACEIKPMLIQVETHPHFPQDALKEYLKPHNIALQAWYPLGHATKTLMTSDVITSLSAKYGKSPAQIILRWHIQCGNIVIPGSKNPAHIEDNLNIFDFALSDEDMALFDSLKTDAPYIFHAREDAKKYLSWHPDIDGQK